MFSNKVSYLCDVDSSKYFYTVNGKVLKNLSDLFDFLSSCSDQDFFHHVNSNKNDFSAWIQNVLKDKSLSDEIYSIREKNQLKDIIELKLNNSSTFLNIEQDLLKKIKDLLSIIEEKEKQFEEKKAKQTKEPFDIENISKLKGIKGILEEINQKLLSAKNLDEKSLSKVYVEVSDDLANITKMLSLIEKKEENRKYQSPSEEQMTKSEILLSEIADSLDKILVSNNQIYDKRQKKLESDLESLKKELANWKMGDVADHQEIKSVFLAFEKNTDYRFGDINEFLEKLKEIYYYDEKIKRHSALINAIDKEIFELKKEVKENTKAVQKGFFAVKELSQKVKNLSKGDYSSHRKIIDT